jgi:hypothetical protein
MLAYRNLFILVVIFSFLISCKKEVKNVLPMEEDKAILLLGDMHFANSAALIHKMEDRDSMKKVYETQVFEIHKVTKQEYENLIKSLESDLNHYFEIEKKVHTHLKDIQNDKT